MRIELGLALALLAGCAARPVATDLKLSPVPGPSVTLAWDSSSSTNVSGYCLYWGIASKGYTNRLDAGTNLQATVSGLEVGPTYWFAATAYDSAGGESAFSDEVSYSLPAPQVFTLTVLSSTNPAGPFTVQADLPSWSVTNEDSAPRYYRLKIDQLP